MPHELPDDVIQAIKARGTFVCPALSGSAYSVWKLLEAPSQRPRGGRKDLFFTIRVLRLPGVACLLLRQPDPMQQWQQWYESSLRNTEKLYRAKVR